MAGTYRAAGVDIEAGDALVHAIAPLAARTARPGSLGGLGGFAAAFDLRAVGYRDPVLLSATDGVGTKLMLAIETGQHETIGIDLVAMVVNDLVTHGAEPLFVLDYFATGALDVPTATRVIAGIAAGCLEAGCALVGGETAEMPGLYAPSHYDLAGFAVGAVERDRILPRAVAPGDTILGLPSSGCHANGYSLVRRVVREAGLLWDAISPLDDGASLGATLLKPTHLYVKPVLALQAAGLLHAAAHVTGGGLPGNLPRVLPPGTCAVLDPGWPVPAVFSWLRLLGAIDPEEMLRVFNCGIGMALVVEDAASATAVLAELGQTAHVIGRVEAAQGPPAVRFSTPVGWPA